MPSGDETPARPFVVCREDEAVPPALAGAVAALGNFDGVHRGHRALIAAARGEAGDAGRPAVVLTFEPHPRAFFAPQLPMFRLSPPSVKRRVFRRLGLDGMVVRRFDADLAATSAQDFVTGLLKRELGLSGVVVGHDFHFGRGRKGTPDLLASFCREVGLGCTVLPVVSLAGDDAPVSSSAIRKALSEGDVARANALLGYRWFVEGEVRHGDKRGRVLGYPTANIALSDCGLAYGIYAVRARLPDGRVVDGVASYGRRPTFDDGAPLLEVNLFGFSGDLYGQGLAVEFVSRIRGEERFPDPAALVARMDLDAAQARADLGAEATPSMIDGPA